MLGTPFLGDQKIISNSGIVGTTALGTGIVSNGTTLLYGGVTELIAAASNTQDSWGISILVWNTGTAGNSSETTMDVLIGGATDDVLIKALIVGGSGTVGVQAYFFPVHVPAGVRIAGNLASIRTSITARALVYLHGGSAPPLQVGSKVTTYGTQSNNARGLTVVPAASGGAASITEMSASTTADAFYFLPGFQQGGADATYLDRAFNIGIGIGASTEERIGTWWFQTSTIEGVTGPFPQMGVFRNVPSGTRLTMLASNSGTNDNSYDGLIYAVS